MHLKFIENTTSLDVTGDLTEGSSAGSGCRLRAREWGWYCYSDVPIRGVNMRSQVRFRPSLELGQLNWKLADYMYLLASRYMYLARRDIFQHLE